MLQFDQIHGAVLCPILLKPLRIIRTTGRPGLALLTCQPDGPGQFRFPVLGNELWLSTAEVFTVTIIPVIRE